MRASTKRTGSVVLAAILLAVGMAIGWLDTRTQMSPGYTLLTVAYAIVTAILLLSGALVLPGIQKIDVWHRVSNGTKSLLSCTVAIVWVAISVKRVPDTDIGVVMILAPFALFSILGGYFYVKSVWIPLK